MPSPGQTGKTLEVGSVLFGFTPSPTLSTIMPHPSYAFPKHRVNATEIRSSFCSPLKSLHSHFSETKQAKDLLAYVERFKEIIVSHELGANVGSKVCIVRFYSWLGGLALSDSKLYCAKKCINRTPSLPQYCSYLQIITNIFSKHVHTYKKFLRQ